jgi:hypothetical protein
MDLLHMPNRKAIPVLLLLVTGIPVLGSSKARSADYGVFSVDTFGVTIFPLIGKPLRIAVSASSRSRNALSWTASPDGKSLYRVESAYGFGSVFRPDKDPPRPSRVIRLDLRSLTTVDVGGVEGIDISTMVARDTSILVSGEQMNKHGACGLWTISVPQGIRKALLEGDCQKGWQLLSLSADFKEALVAMTDGINLVDLDQLKVRKLPSRFQVASLSPDAKLIAATEQYNPDQLFLLDPIDFSVRRKLTWHGGGRPLWSPDGRYLLGSKREFHCFVTNFALDVDAPQTPVLVEVSTGKTRTLGSARCKYEELSGWIASR